MPWGIAALALGAASTVMGSKAQKDAAKAAADEAKRIREYYEGKARDTKALLSREIETMRTLRSLDMPAYQQAAQTAFIQRQRGQELQSRARNIGRLGGDYREAIFGGQAEQYFGRESQKLQRYQQMTQGIFQASTQMQEQVNSLLAQGGSEYSSMMQQSQAMKAEAGDPWGKALGAMAQGAGMMSSQNAANKRMDKQMAYDAYMDPDSTLSPEQWQGRQTEFDDYWKNKQGPSFWDKWNPF